MRPITAEFTTCFIVVLALATGAGEGASVMPGRKLCPLPPNKAPPPGMIDTKEQVRDLRYVMSMDSYEQGLPVDAYIVTSNDEHQSESVPERDRRCYFLTGFAGSNGLAVVTATRAGVWTDGRYFLQADQQLDCQWELVHTTVAEWLSEGLGYGARVGADPKLMSNFGWQTLEEQLASVNMTLVEVKENLIDKIWTKGRPAYPSYPAFVYNISYAGVSWQDKVQDVRTDLLTYGADAMIVTSLDEVAWLLNIRGRDVRHNPVVRAYVILSHSEIHLYVNETKVNAAIRAHLLIRNCISDKCVRVHPYEDALGDLRTFTQQWNKVLLPSRCVYDQGVSRAVYSAVQPPDKRLSRESPIVFQKARKNSVEIHGMRAAHIRDAVAMCDFLAYFEDKLSSGRQWTEMKVAQTIDQFRREQVLSYGTSFSTIVGYGPNGAQPHYRPTNQTDAVIGNTTTLVVDSGGQYLDGTTDVTRTLHFGNPTDFEKEVYTRVLIGSIQLASLVFPAFLKTSAVDVLARGPLWMAGLDYEHGTGHGIGTFLGVHESPIGILYSEGNYSFEKGNFFSDEPGYYKEGQFGVRLENILEVEERSTKHSLGENYLGFRVVTLVPFEPKLINVAMLSHDHRKWLNDYNVQIRLKVGPELKAQRRMKGFHWMMSKTGYIPEHCVVRGAASRYHSASWLLGLVLAAVITAC
ncbi:xaa-Pro aminopeptidase 1 [Anabrus simplex]|uniref:xaa-Pro aminopeptidase 1 n=1 Tax=Anabrus simplex TaxID=316456 RepID=UPI0035A2C922